VSGVTPRSIATLTPYGVLALTHLGAQAVEADRLSAVTQVLLMPALALLLMLQRPGQGRLTTLTLVALGWSWLGDTVPRLLDGDPEFLVMVGCFLVAQVAYIGAFRPYRYESILHRRRPWLIPYGVGVVLLVAVCLPGSDWLAPAVVAYGGCLLVMAVLATGIHRLATVGGVLFLVSDGLIALDAFAGWWALPQQDVAVMTAYIIAQLLLVLGVLRRATEEEPAYTPLPSSALQE
jgi:uncharacterized membrane protein YhhN